MGNAWEGGGGQAGCSIVRKRGKEEKSRWILNFVCIERAHYSHAADRKKIRQTPLPLVLSYDWTGGDDVLICLDRGGM